MSSIDTRRPRPYGQLTFIFQSDGAVNGLNKSSINAHIAKQGHRRHQIQERRLRKSRTEAYSKTGTNLVSASVAEYVTGTLSSDNDYESSMPPPTVLAGNSDPFSCKGVTITAEINHLLTFTRDFILPAFHTIEATVADGRLHMYRFWEDTIGSLDNEERCVSHAYLARSAAVMSTMVVNKQTINLLALKLRTLATSKLTQSKLTNRMGAARTQHSVEWDVYALFCAETAACSFDNAAIHGRMLRHLLQAEENGCPAPSVNPERRLLMAVLREDMTRACLSLTRPSFDLHRWRKENLPTKMLGSVGDGEYRPSALPLEVELSQSLTDHTSEIFWRIREWLHALGVVMLNRELFDLTLLSNGSMSIMVQEGHLLNHYLDCMQRWNIDSSRDALEEACVSLAALYWVRRAAHENMGGGSRLELAGCHAFDMSPMAVTQLQRLHQLLEMDEIGREWSLPQRLWTMYVGALAERVVGSRMACGDYHRVRFRHLVNTQGFCDWNTVKDSLRQFLYVDMAGLEARLW